jgi:hypothetical protein
MKAVSGPLRGADTRPETDAHSTGLGAGYAADLTGGGASGWSEFGDMHRAVNATAAIFTSPP